MRQDVSAEAVRRLELVSGMMLEAGEQIRTVARLLRGDDSAISVPSATELVLESGSALDRLDALGARRADLLQELENLESDQAAALASAQREMDASVAAMHHLGAAEAEADMADDESQGVAQQRLAAARDAAEGAHRRAAAAQATAQSAAMRAEHTRHELALVDARLAEVRARLREIGAARTEEIPVRELTLTSLDEIALPCPSNLLSRYIAARFGREIKSSRWGPLRADERAAYERADEQARASRVWLQPARAPGGRELTRIWVRSDWDDTQRTVRDPSESALLLARACHLAELAVNPPDETVDPPALAAVALEEAVRAHRYPEGNQSDEEFLADLAGEADYVQWPAPNMMAPTADDVPF